MSESGVDLADIQQHMGHKRIDTTRRHYVPVLGSRLQRASELIDGRFGWTPTDKPKVGTGI
jgi:integrase